MAPGSACPWSFEIAERHGATLEIQSQPGQGTRIELVFPAAGAEAKATAPALAKIPPLPSLRLLVVDDDRILLETLADVLAGDGHQVVASPGGEAGIAAFRAARGEGAPFHVVLTDLGMPEVDGRQVAAAIKEVSPFTPVVLLTGWGDRMISDREQPAFVDLVLSKPPRLKDLRETLQRLASGSASRIPVGPDGKPGG